MYGYVTQASWSEHVTGYYLACLETNRYVWIGLLSETTSAAGVEADLVSSFCFMHRGKSLVVVSETHQIIGEGQEWEC